MLDYIIKVLLFQTLFLAVYDLFLKKETFFQWNRVYLITTSVLAYILPLIKIKRVQEMIPQEYVVMLPEVILNPTTVIEQQFDWSMLIFLILKVIFLFGVVVTGILFVLRLYKIIKLIATNDKEVTSNYYLVWLKNNRAFSFFNYIFLRKESENKTQIIEHELVHVRQKHSLDLLFFEFQKIIFWFNPYSYLYQVRIAELHEFIADSKAIKTENKTIYFNNLLSEAFSTQNISFINPFFKKSLLKKRIVMLNKNKSKQLLKLKYLLLIPVLAGMLVYTSCGKNQHTMEKENNEITVGLKEIVLGTHFGIFVGEPAPNGEKISYESLSVAEKAEYNKWKQMSLARQKKDVYEFTKFEIYKMANGKKTIHGVTKWKVKKNDINKTIDGEDVPFAVIENAPIFPGCEDAENIKKCLQKSIQMHVNKKFNTGITKTLGLSPGKKRVITDFKIDKEGNIVDVKARGPHADLEREATRVINSLPKMIPGEQRGKKVGVKYTLPITFMVGSDEEKKQGYNYEGKTDFKSQLKVLASINSSQKLGIVSGNVNGIVSGKLKGLPGVNVSIKGKNKIVYTDFDGNFKIKAEKGETLVLDFKGFPKTEFKINENNNYKVTM